MKKLFVLIITVILISTLAVSVSAEAKLLGDYGSAKDGDLLFIADFNSTSTVFYPFPNAAAADGVTYTPSSDGTTLNIKGIEGYDSQRFMYGSVINGLPFDKTTSYTMVYKVKMNGEIGKNNSIGIGGIGWHIDLDDSMAWRFFNNYGNYNSVFEGGANEVNRTAISVSQQKMSDYTNGIEDAIDDDDGFVLCRIDFDGPNQKVLAYAMTINGWTFLEEQAMAEPNGEYEDIYMENASLGFFLYTYYEVVDATVKDVRYYKGINLTAEQLAVTSVEEPAAETPVEAEAPAEDGSAEDAPAAEAPTAPKTADAGIVLAAAVMACAAGVILSKKH